MGEVIRFPAGPYFDALVRRLRSNLDEVAGEWKRHGASARYWELRDDVDRTMAALIRNGLPSQAVLRQALRPKRARG